MLEGTRASKRCYQHAQEAGRTWNDRRDRLLGPPEETAVTFNPRGERGIVGVARYGRPVGPASAQGPGHLDQNGSEILAVSFRCVARRERPIELQLCRE